MCVIEKGAAAVKKHVEDDNYDKNLVKAIMRHMSWEFTSLFVLSDCVCMLKECTYIFICRDIHICGCIRKYKLTEATPAVSFAALGSNCELAEYMHTNALTQTKAQSQYVFLYMCVNILFFRIMLLNEP